MVDRYAKFATENFSVAAARIEGQRDDNVVELSRFLSRWANEESKGLS